MTIRIQPKEITIPDESGADPFANDSLGRKESIEILTHLVQSVEEPCTIAVDTPWGTGKTTFLNLRAQYLHINKFAVVKFSAWENDFFDDPFVALCSELMATENSRIDTAEFKKAVVKVIKYIGWNAASKFSGGIVDKSVVSEELTTDIEKRLKQYQDAKSAIADFRETLQETAATTSTNGQHRPLIIMIDELDRCRPSYAVEFLEIAKHIFSVDNIIIVMAINRSELAHSVRAIYGADFNAEGYLQRFFDLDFQLPEPDKAAFIKNLFEALGIDEYIENTKSNNSEQLIDPYKERPKKLFQEFSKAFDLSLRQIQQAVHRLGLVLASLPNSQYSLNCPGFTGECLV